MEIQVSCQLSMDKSRLLQLLEGGGGSARVGCKAPQFDVPAHIRGELTRVRLEDLLGKWVILFFYPGDFTFV